jgi:hypothetical protein
MVSLKRARMAKKRFLKSRYFDRKRMTGIGISRVRECHIDDAADIEKNDHCIVINFGSIVQFWELEAVLPERYYGVRIYAKVVGGITLH